MYYKKQLNRRIKLVSPPQHIISLVPSQSELLYNLNLDKEVIGITKFCIKPSKWKKSKTIIGGTKNPNIEKIQKLQPDLIIANKEENREEDIALMSNLAPVWISDVNNFQDALNMILDLSKICNREKNGNELIAKIEHAKNSFQIQLAKKYSVLYFIWQNPYMLAGKNTFIDAMLSIAGFENLVQTARYPVPSLLELQNFQPDIILLPDEPFPFKEKHKLEIKKIFPRAKIHLIKGEYFTWYGSRLLKSFQYFRSLHEQVKD